MINVLYVMWLRQLKRYWRSKARMLSSLGQPILFLLALGFGFGPMYAKAGGGDYISFLAPGIISMSVLFSSMFMGMELIWDRQFGFLKETLVAPISRLSIIVGRTLGGATVALLQGIIVIMITLIVGFRPEGLILALIFLFLIAILFTALGTGLASRLQDMHAFPMIINFIIMPVFFLSGALFPLKDIPGAIGIITNLNPLSYGVDGVRGALTGVWQYGILLDLSVMLASIAVVFAISSLLFENMEV